MTITLYWWILPLAAFLFPFVYVMVRKPEGGMFPNMLDPIIFMVSWAVALAIIVGHYVR